LPRTLNCKRGRCRRKGAKLFDVAIPAVIEHDVSPMGLCQVAGGGSVHHLIQLCGRHEERIRRFTRWGLRLLR